VSRPGDLTCESCGAATNSVDGQTVRLVREQDRGSCEALGWSAMSCRSFMVPVVLCSGCHDAEVTPDGYFDLAEVSRTKKGGAS